MKFLAKKSLVLAAFFGLVAMPALAQPWEEVLGPPTTKEQGEKRVAPIRLCPGDGYIAVGTLDTGGISHAYVVRTKANGNNIWEISYDISADGRPDEGNAIVELADGTGFVVLGSTTPGTQWSPYLMKIDCNGAPQWTMKYNPPVTTTWNLFGRDLVQAKTGSTATGTAPGDFLVAGFVDYSATSSDAFLMRTRVNGGLIWNRRYSTGASIERFFGLTEARPTVSATGDVVGVGVWAPAGATTQALALRVSGDTGLLGAAPQCAFTYGGSRDESFSSVIELQTAPETGNLAMAGLSTTPGLGEDIYLVKTQRNPCTVLAQSTIGNSVTGLATGEVANDLTEVLAAVDPAIGVPVGALALTGYSGTLSGARRDAYLLFAKAANLLPITGNLFGDHAGRNDSGASLAQNPAFGVNPPGFIIAGMSESDFEGLGDPRDLYQINPNNSAKTNCSISWLPPGFNQAWVSTSPPVASGPIVQLQSVQTILVTHNTNFINCP